MNLAISTIFILVLILPGILFRFAYLKGPHSKQNFKPSTIDEIIWAIVPSLFFHIIGFIYIDVCTPYKIDFKVIFILVSLNLEELNFETIDINIYPFILYLSALLIASFCVGLLLRKVVIQLKLDYKFNFFRINNDWYYILTNNLNESDENKASNELTAEFIQIDVLVKGDKEFYIIYSGILHDFYLSKDEGLDKICLVEVHRRRFSDDIELESANSKIENQKLGDRYYSMPGDLFVIPYSHILNMNISYYTFSKENENLHGK